jgi:hypothetical protein
MLLVASAGCDVGEKACLLHSHCASAEQCLEGLCVSPPEPVDVGKVEAGPIEAGPVDSGSNAGDDVGVASDAAADVGSGDTAPSTLDGPLVDSSPRDSNSSDGAMTDLLSPLGDSGLVSDVLAADAGRLGDTLTLSAEAGP